MNEIGNIIRKARETKRWTQEQVADKMGISLRQYNKYEAGLLPKYKSTVAEEIDSLLGTNIKELIYEQNVPRATKENTVEEPIPDYIKPDYRDEYIALLKENLSLNQGKAALYMKTNQALLKTVVQQLAELRARLEKKPLKDVQVETNRQVEQHLRMLTKEGM